MKPLLRWAGGKRRLLEPLLCLVRGSGGHYRYVEPFLGGGAVFFALSGRAPVSALLADACPDLMGFYRAVRDNPFDLLETVNELLRVDDYAGMVQNLPDTELGMAARMAYLNLRGFNGLWRVNANGRYNAPRGDSVGRLRLPDVLDASIALEKSALASVDFRIILSACGEGDLVYCDPPYPGGFTGYTAAGFSWEDHVDLAYLARVAADRGAKVMVSNLATPDVLDLYTDFRAVPAVLRHTISGVAFGRKSVREVIFTSWGLN